jgi:hypothetical protein
MPNNVLKIMLKMTLQIQGNFILTSGVCNFETKKSIAMGPPRGSSAAFP